MKLKTTMALLATIGMSSAAIADDKKFEIMAGSSLSATSISQPMKDGVSATDTTSYNAMFQGKYYLTDIIGLGGLLSFSQSHTSMGSDSTRYRSRNIVLGPVISAELPITKNLSIEGTAGIQKVWQWDRSSFRYMSYTSDKNDSAYKRNAYTSANKGWRRSVGVNLKLALSESVKVLLGLDYSKTKISYNSNTVTNSLDSRIGLVYLF